MQCWDNNSVALTLVCHINLQATKLFLRHRLPKGLVVTRFSVWFKILYCVIYMLRLIQHCLRSKVLYFNVKYVIATRTKNSIVSFYEHFKKCARVDKLEARLGGYPPVIFYFRK